MKTWTSILAAGAILAFAAPAGYAAAGHIPANSGGNQHAVTVVSELLPPLVSVHKGSRLDALVARNKALEAKYQALLARNKGLKAKLEARNTPVPFRVVAPFLPGPPVSADQSSMDDCLTYMFNCTEEQFCAYLGAYCTSVPAPADTPIDATPAAPAAAETAVADGFQNAGSRVEPVIAFRVKLDGPQDAT